MTSRYEDRFDEAKYSDDEPVAFWLDAIGSNHDWANDEPADTVWMPERIFVRAQFIARAYELRLLPAIDEYARTQLNQLQCETLNDEISLITSVSYDPLLIAWFEKVQQLTVTCVRASGRQQLNIEGP